MITEKVRHDEWLYEKLRDPGFAAEYLTAAAEDEESVVFLQALRKVAGVQGMERLPNEPRFHGKVSTACFPQRAILVGRRSLRSSGRLGN